MVRKWQAGGQELYDDQVPYAPGTPQYYRYVAMWRAKAMGITYDAPKGFDDDAWKDGGDGKNRAYWAAQEAQTRARDKSGTGTPAGYAQAVNPLTGRLQYYRDLNGDGQFNAGVEGWGQYGGAGARNPGISASNAWNELDGADVRTDEQKFYDRDTSNFSQVADENGTYNWYADWEYRDGTGTKQKKKINLTYLGNRTGTGDQYGAGQNYTKQPGAAYSGHDYWNYNDAPDKNWFADAIRKRENLSKYARTA